MNTKKAASVDTAVEELVKELRAALDVLEPQIRGLEDFVAPISISPELLAVNRQQLDEHRHRRDLIQAVLDALSALLADGYPATPPVELPPSLYIELQKQLADFGAAAGIYTQGAPATGFDIKIGPPRDKEN